MITPGLHGVKACRTWCNSGVIGHLEVRNIFRTQQLMGCDPLRQDPASMAATMICCFPFTPQRPQRCAKGKPELLPRTGNAVPIHGVSMAVAPSFSQYPVPGVVTEPKAPGPPPVRISTQARLLEPVWQRADERQRGPDRGKCVGKPAGPSFPRAVRVRHDPASLVQSSSAAVASAIKSGNLLDR